MYENHSNSRKCVFINTTPSTSLPGNLKYTRSIQFTMPTASIFQVQPSHLALKNLCLEKRGVRGDNSSVLK